MTRRDWILAWAASLSCVLPACTRQEIARSTDDRVDVAVVNERPPSPYHEISVAPQPSDKPADGPAQIAAQPTKTPAVSVEATAADSPPAEVITISAPNVEEKPSPEEPLVSAVRCFV